MGSVGNTTANTLLSRLQGKAAEAAGIRTSMPADPEADALVRVIFEEAFQLMGVLTPDGTLIRINRSALEFIHADEHEVAGQLFWKTPWWAHSEEEQARLREAILDAAAGAFVRFETTHCRPDGGITTIDFSIKPVRDRKGKVILLVPEGRDVSERKKLEAELKAARDKAEEATRAKSEFLANMSHEIRTPMSGVLGMIDLLLQGQPTDEQRRQLQMAKQSAQSLLRLIGDILDFSKIEARRLTFEKKPFNLRDCIKSAIDVVALDARKKKLHLLVTTATEVPETVVGDEARLRQVMINLLGNAVKFTDQGEVEVRVDPADCAPELDNLVKFTVRDTGIGIPADKLQCLFLTFSQIDGTHTRRYGGTGIGLALSRQIVRQMGGDIVVESEVGKGSKFSFTTCLPPAEERELPGFSAREDGSGMPDISCPLRVLLAEDDETIRRMVELLLTRKGISFVSAIDGLQALEASEKERFDIIFMDIQMPHMDGIQVTKTIRLREKASGDHIPIIAMTAHAMEGDEAAFLKDGMDAYISKPIDFKTFYALLDRYGCGRG